MKIKLLRDCRIRGEHCEAGSVVDAADEDARYLIRTGSAEAAGKEKRAKSVRERTVRVRMLRTCMVEGAHREEGETIGVRESTARMLVAHAFAEEAPEKPEKEKKQEKKPKEADDEG